jgi:hypothetical protein
MAVLETYNSTKTLEITITPQYASGGNVPTGAIIRANGITEGDQGGHKPVEYQEDFTGLPVALQDACRLLFNAGGKKLSLVIGEAEDPVLP